jgi:hypothetical protein
LKINFKRRLFKIYSFRKYIESLSSKKSTISRTNGNGVENVASTYEYDSVASSQVGLFFNDTIFDRSLIALQKISLFNSEFFPDFSQSKTY